jgi:hypothetical protein
MDFYFEADLHIEGKFHQSDDVAAERLLGILFQDTLEDFLASFPGHLGIATVHVVTARKADPHWFRDGPLWARAS